ncbi:unnamed protein product [Brassica rapa]|uniref:Uncharacterized protein n=1 Tax=Brassica campestris TaxID=3711 RepID=A0A8D9GLC7_BRACM|nr:unnamed protein product [Brassica rapa]
MSTLNKGLRPTPVRPERRRPEKRIKEAGCRDTWKHLNPRNDTRRNPPRPDLLRLETPPGPPHHTLVTPDLENPQHTAFISDDPPAKA